MPSTLAEVLSEDRVGFDDLHDQYNPVLQLVNVLIGVVPNCDPYLEIWPPGFRTYNLMVPNFLNLPASLLGLGASKDVIGLAMYTSSRAADCMYCSAHTCSFALRRGSSAEAVTGEKRTEAEAAAVAVAEALSTVPDHYTPELGKNLRQHFSADDAEWIVMSVAMMGFLNKFMDAIGVELEAAAVDDVSNLISETGWKVGQHGWADDDLGTNSTTQNDGQDDTRNDAQSAAEHDTDAPPTDSVGTMFRVFRNAPGAVKLEKKWMAGLPKRPDELRGHIANTYHLDEPLLDTMKHARTTRALAAMLRHNLDPEQSEIGIANKALAGLVFATHAGNRHLVNQSKQLAAHYGVSAETIEAVAGYLPVADTGSPTAGSPTAGSPTAGSPASSLDAKTAAIITTAYDISPSPATVSAEVIELATTTLTSAETVETVVWVSICQLIHRLSLFFGLNESEPT